MRKPRKRLVEIRWREKRKEAANKRTAPRYCRSAAVEKSAECGRKSNGLGRRRSGGRRRGPGEGVRTGFLLRGPVDLDGAFEVGAVFDHDAGGGEVTVDRTIFLDFNSILGAKVALHVAEHHDLAGNDVGGYFCRGADSQLPLIEL